MLNHLVSPVNFSNSFLLKILCITGVNGVRSFEILKVWSNKSFVSNKYWVSFCEKLIYWEESYCAVLFWLIYHSVSINIGFKTMKFSVQQIQYFPLKEALHWFKCDWPSKCPLTSQNFTTQDDTVEEKLKQVFFLSWLQS